MSSQNERSESEADNMNERTSLLTASNINGNNSRQSMISSKRKKSIQQRKNMSQKFTSSSNSSGKIKRTSSVMTTPNTSTSRTTSSAATNPNPNQYFYVNQLLSVINDRRSRFQQNFSFTTILFVNILERFAYYGLICNYILYLNKRPLYWETYNASFVLFIFLGITNISGVVGGWIADSFVGKYATICFSFVIYILGYIAFPLLSYNQDSVPGFCKANSSIVDWTTINYTTGLSGKELDVYFRVDRSAFEELCSWVIITTMFMVGIGVGFLRANLGPFGADQVISRGQTMVFKYFNWLYWCINIGSLSSFSILAYVQQNVNFFIGYLVPFVSLVLAFLLFLVGTFSYIRKEAEFPVLSTIFKVIYEAYQTIKRKKNLLKQKQRERA
jgi:hypothetical protein